MAQQTSARLAAGQPPGHHPARPMEGAPWAGQKSGGDFDRRPGVARRRRAGRMTNVPRRPAGRTAPRTRASRWRSSRFADEPAGKRQRERSDARRATGTRAPGDQRQAVAWQRAVLGRRPRRRSTKVMPSSACTQCHPLGDIWVPHGRLRPWQQDAVPAVGRSCGRPMDAADERAAARYLPLHCRRFQLEPGGDAVVAELVDAQR